MEFELLRKKIDYKLRDKEAKDLLNRAVIDGELVYIRGDKYRAAGYYPSARSEELAKEVKRAKTRAKNRQD